MVMEMQKIVDVGPVIGKLAAMALQAKGLECSLLGTVIDMLRTAPDIELSEQDAPYWATEAAYKNGYAAGKRDATDNNVGSKWIPVTERLPEEDGEYLVTIRSMGVRYYEVLSFATDGEAIDYYELTGKKNVWYEYASMYGYVTVPTVTHWMPLPAPPEEVD